VLAVKDHALREWLAQLGRGNLLWQGSRLES